MQPDLGYIGEDGKLHDDGLHDEMLASEAGNGASRKAAYDAAVESGVDKATARVLWFPAITGYLKHVAGGVLFK